MEFIAFTFSYLLTSFVKLIVCPIPTNRFLNVCWMKVKKIGWIIKKLSLFLFLILFLICLEMTHKKGF